MEYAAQARAAAALLGHEVLAGVGTGGGDFLRSSEGRVGVAPASRVAEYMHIARTALTGEPVLHSGNHYSVGMQLPKMSGPGAKIGAGVLRPRMARTAGANADFIVTWLTPASWLADTIIPALDRGAAEAGRPRPHVVTYVHAAIARNGRAAERLAEAGNRDHLRAEHYADMLRRAGVVKESEPATARALIGPEDLAAGLFLRGLAVRP